GRLQRGQRPARTGRPGGGTRRATCGAEPQRRWDASACRDPVGATGPASAGLPMSPPRPDLITDPYDVIEERFAAVQGDSRLERLFDGCRWAEGPVYVPAGRYLLFSDIPNDRMLRWDETTDQVGVFRQPSGYANGHTRDRTGRLVSCEHGNRRVTRTEHDGTVTVIADR